MKYQKITKQKLRLVVAATAAIIAEVAFPMLGGSAHAAPPQFQSFYLRLDRMKAVTATGGTICAKPATVATENDFEITFPTQVGTDFTVNSTAANWTTTVTNLPAGSTAWPGLGGGTPAS